MTVEKAIGMEYNTLNEFNGTVGNVTISTPVRTGAYALNLPGGATPFSYSATINVASRSEYYFQLAFQFQQNLPTADLTCFKWMKSSTVLGGLKITDDGRIEAWTGDFVDLRGTSTSVLTAGTWHLLQVRIQIGDSGILQVKLGSSLEIDFSGDTKPGADTEIDRFVIGQFSNTGSYGNVYIDDIVIFNTLGTKNNSWPNGVGVHVIRPNATGNYAQWDKSAGANNYECVDELPPSETDYVYNNTNAEKDSYNLPACPIMGEIAAVIADYWGYAAGAPAITQIKRLMRISSTDYESSGITLLPTFSKHTDVVELNPADSQPWEPADIDSLELGMTSLT